MNQEDATLRMLKDLTDANGIPGNEKEPREVMRRYIEPYADEVTTDALGGLIARKRGTADSPRIMVAGHLDEIGFMVTHIDDKGFLRFQTVGGWWEQVMLAQRVTVMTRKGNVPGVIGSKPPHVLSAEARKKPVDKKDMFIDIGASSREEALEFGVRPGDSVVPVCEFTVMKNEKLLMAKAWDNRIGCAIAIEILRQLQNGDHPNTVYAVGTVQEEVGLRGAKTAAYEISPDIGFSVDVGIAGDTPGITEKEALAKLGKGPQILVYDGSMIAHKGLRDLVTDTAEELGIPYQFDYVAGGGTDAGAIHVTKSGVPSLAVSVATRYIHSHAAILHRDDFENAVKLLTAVIRRLDAETIAELKLK
jgi:endoglucanase